MKFIRNLNVEKTLAIAAGLVSASMGSVGFANLDMSVDDPRAAGPLSKLEYWLKVDAVPASVVEVFYRELGINLRVPEQRQKMVDTIRRYRAIVNSRQYVGKLGYLGDGLDVGLLVSVVKESISHSDKLSQKAMMASIMCLETN